MLRFALLACSILIASGPTLADNRIGESEAREVEAKSGANYTTYIPDNMFVILGFSGINDNAGSSNDTDTMWESCSGGSLNIEIADSSKGSTQFHTTKPDHKYVETLTLRGPLTTGSDANDASEKDHSVEKRGPSTTLQYSKAIEWLLVKGDTINFTFQTFPNATRIVDKKGAIFAQWRDVKLLRMTVLEARKVDKKHCRIKQGH